MKKNIFFIFSIFVILISIFISYKITVKAEDTITYKFSTVDVSLRTSNDYQGIKFSTTLTIKVGETDVETSNYNNYIKECGFFLCNYNLTGTQISNKISEYSADENFINDGIISYTDSETNKKVNIVRLKFNNGESVAKTFSAILYFTDDNEDNVSEINEAALNGTIGAVPYYILKDDSTNTYNYRVNTKNVVQAPKTTIADTVRNIINSNNGINGTSDYSSCVFIKSVVDATKVQLVTSSTTYYYSDFTDDFNSNLEKNSTINLLEGTYEKQLKANKDNLVINGPNMDIDGTSESRIGEAILSDGISISKDGIIVNGISSTGGNAIRLYGSRSNIIIKNSILKPSSNSSIIDVKSSGMADYSEIKSTNIIIQNNLIQETIRQDDASTTDDETVSYTLGINLRGYANNLEILDNKFVSNATLLSAKSFGIKIAYISNDSYININGNKFNRFGDNYLIDLGYGHDDDSRYTAYINIEDNYLSSETSKMLGGNGIRILWMGDSTLVNVTRNLRFCMMSCYNAMFLSTTDTITGVVDNVTPQINVRYNQFYCNTNSAVNLRNDEDEFTGTGRELNKKYLRIGSNLNSSNLLFDSNYFYDRANITASSYVYLDLSNKTATKSEASGTIKNNYASNASTANENYKTYVSNLSTFTSYISTANNDSTDLENNNINIQNNILVYYENDAAYAIAVKKQGYAVGEKTISIQDAVKNMAYLYFDQGTQIQYDQNSTERRNLNASPEQATEYQQIYLDCSSYVNSIYYNVFGINLIEIDGSNYTRIDTENIMAFAKNNEPEEYNSENYILYYVDNVEGKYNKTNALDEESIETLLSNIQDNLQVGDLICYRHGKTTANKGHIMIYVGEGQFLHATGNSFNYEDNPSESTDTLSNLESSSGAIIKSSSYALFNQNGSRYLFKEWADETKNADYVRCFAVLRPLNMKKGTNTVSLSTSDYTDQMENRLNIQGLSIEKVSESANMSTVICESEITYKVVLKNNNNRTLYNINVNDVVNDNCTYVKSSINNKGSYNEDGKKISWTISSLTPGSTITLSYKVTVNSEIANGTIINSNQTTVNGVKTNDLYHVVAGDLNKNKLTSNSTTLLDNSDATYTDWRDMVDAVYKDVLTSTQLDNYISSRTQVFTLLNATIDSKSTYLLDTDDKAYNILVKDMYGGTKFIFNESMIRSPKSDYLECGDIILTYYYISSSEKEYKAYIYISDTCMLGLNTENKIINVYSNKDDIDEFLNILIGYDLYAVLRPSIGTYE